MNLSEEQLQQIIYNEIQHLLEHAKEYVWGVKGPGKVANQYLLHRLSSEKLRSLLLEELEEMGKEINLASPQASDFKDLLSKLLNTIENLDMSIDYLAAAVTGESPLEIKFAQAGLGRLYTPPGGKALPIEKA